MTIEGRRAFGLSGRHSGTGFRFASTPDHPPAPFSGPRWQTLSLLGDYFFPQILGGLRHVLRTAEIAPIIFVRAEGEDFFSLASEAQVGGDDGERALLTHHRKQTRRNDVNARKCQRLKLLGGPNKWIYNGAGGRCPTGRGRSRRPSP